MSGDVNAASEAAGHILMGGVFFDSGVGSGGGAVSRAWVLVAGLGGGGLRDAEALFAGGGQEGGAGLVVVGRGVEGAEA
jgi:hypothetical protein